MIAAIGRWVGRSHLSTWLLIVALITIALIVRPQLLNFVVFAVVGALLFITRDLARLEGRQPHFGRSTLIAIAVLAMVVAIMLFGVRYVAI